MVAPSLKFQWNKPKQAGAKRLKAQPSGYTRLSHQTTCTTYSFRISASIVIQSNLSLRPPDKSDHLKIPDTPFQSLQFSDSNVRSVFLKMRPPEKCELRTPYVGPKLRINLGKATKYVKLSEKNFFDRPTFPSQALRTSDHRVCKLDLAWSLPITPRVHVGTTDR